MMNRRGVWKLAGFVLIVGLKALCFSFIKKYWISMIFYLQRLKSKCHVTQRLKVFLSPTDVIKYIWHECKMVILESRMKTPQMGLYALSMALSQTGVAKKIQVIAKARVPIIKFVEKRSGISFDVRESVEIWCCKDGRW
ncbi:putative Nucleotidyltransferase superfamily [Helianthus debilis subsp. tardiflorus]